MIDLTKKSKEIFDKDIITETKLGDLGKDKITGCTLELYVREIYNTATKTVDREWKIIASDNIGQQESETTLNPNTVKALKRIKNIYDYHFPSIIKNGLRKSRKRGDLYRNSLAPMIEIDNKMYPSITIEKIDKTNSRITIHIPDLPLKKDHKFSYVHIPIYNTTTIDEQQAKKTYFVTYKIDQSNGELVEKSCSIIHSLKNSEGRYVKQRAINVPEESIPPEIIPLRDRTNINCLTIKTSGINGLPLQTSDIEVNVADDFCHDNKHDSSNSEREIPSTKLINKKNRKNLINK